MRSILLSLAVVMLAVLSACDGDSETSDEGAGEDSSATEIATSEGSGAAAPDGSDTANDGGAGGGGDATGGTSDGDIEQFIADLEPPNSSGMSRDVRDGITYITWETSESLDALQGFYEDVIADAGYAVSSRGSAGVSFEWIFGPEGDSDFRGILTVSPTSGGSLVAAQIGSGS